MNYIQYMKPGSKFWALPNGLEDVSWSEFWSNWKKAIAKAKEQIVDNWENLKQDYKDAADPTAASERKQAESIEATRAKQASMKFVSDNRTDYEKKRDRKNFKLKEFEQKEQLNKDATDAMMWTLTGIPYAVQHLVSPNGVVKTYGNTKAAVQNGGGPYLEKAVASAAGDVLDAAILTAPLFTPEAQLARQLNKNIKESVQLGQYYHGSPNRSIAQFKVGKDGGIYFTPSKDAAKLYTGLFGTGKVYNANLNLGDNVVTIDNGGRPWTKIPEEVVAKEFGITKQQVHDIIGSYNLGETPWHYGLTKHFGYRPKNNYYAIDLVVRLGKDLGVTGLVIQNARDNGKRLFSKNIPYDQTIVFDPKLITLNPLHAADEAVLRGQLGWAPKQTIPYRHGSLDPELQTFVPKYDRWDVTTHGADPYMYFVTDQSTPVSAANMMDLRPYQYTGNIVAEKPMVQVGDFNVAGKNATRNQLISRARQGADTYLLQDIVDNKVPHLNIVARFIGPEGEAVQGGAASIKWYGPTMGKTTPTKTSLAFFERLPAKISKGERLGIPKGLERTIINNEEEILNNAKSFAEKYGYEIPETIDEAKAMYNLHNSFFRTPSNHESVILHYDPELAKLPLELLYFKLASKGYPESMRSYDFSKNGIYNDDFVFVAPDYGEVMPYINDVPAVMLRRPFRKSNPLTWHKDAEWTIQSKYTPYDQVFGKNKIGTAQIGNAGPLHEFKVSTRYLQPVKIAEPADKGTLLGIHLGPYEYKSGGTIKIKKKNLGSFTRYCNGKVTEECIRKGKNSSNPTTRKRANFAWVARHKFKHEEGGKLNYLNYFN